MSVSPLNALSPAALLIVWLFLFIVLADVSCPLFHTCYACLPCRRGNGYGRRTDD